jgi:hypothetical protein
MSESVIPGCPRCGIGKPIFGDSCIVCFTMPEPHAALLKQVLEHRLAAEAKVAELEQREQRWANDFRRMETRMSKFLDRAEKAESKVTEQAATIAALEHELAVALRPYPLP